MASIDREQLLKSLESVTAGLSTREIIEQSSCFVFTEGRVVTYNDMIACSQSTNMPNVGAIQAKRLLLLLQKLPDDTIEVETGEGKVKIKGKNRKAWIAAEKDILLPIDSIHMPKEWQKLHSDFLEALGMVQECAGKDETKPSSTFIHIHPEWIEAFDNYQAARFYLPTGMSKPILVRQVSLKYIIGLGMTEWGLTKSWMHFRNSSGLTLSCRREIDEFFDLTKILQVKGEKTAFPKGLADAVDRAEIFSSEDADNNQVTVKIDRGKVTVEGSGLTGGFSEVKKNSYSGNPYCFAISPTLLIEIIKKYSECQITKNRLRVDGGKFQYVTTLNALSGKEKESEETDK